jgi:hypothetical protein
VSLAFVLEKFCGYCWVGKESFAHGSSSLYLALC